MARGVLLGYDTSAVPNAVAFVWGGQGRKPDSELADCQPSNRIDIVRRRLPPTNCRQRQVRSIIIVEL